MNTSERVLMGSSSNHLQTTTLLSPFWEIPQLPLVPSLLHILVLFSETFCNIFLLPPTLMVSSIEWEKEGERVKWSDNCRRGGKERKKRKQETLGKNRDVTQMWETHKAKRTSALLIDEWGNRCFVLHKITAGSYMWSSYLPSFCSSHYILPKSSVTTQQSQQEWCELRLHLITLIYITVPSYCQLLKKDLTVGRCWLKCHFFILYHWVFWFVT